MNGKTLKGWVVGGLAVTTIDFVAIFCDVNQPDVKSVYSPTEWVIGFMGHVSFILDIPMLAIRMLIEGDPWSTIGFHLPFSIVDKSDRLTYFICRILEDVCICFVIFLLWRVVLFIWQLIRRKNSAAASEHKSHPI